jgi:catalase-peroxidase
VFEKTQGLHLATDFCFRRQEIADLKQQIMQAGCSVASLVRVAWGSASTYRATDHRGGANGARIRLVPQKDWAANNPAELAQVLQKLERIKGACPMKVSLADLIVLGGCAAVEAAAFKAGSPSPSPSSPGTRTPRWTRPTWSPSACWGRAATRSATTT